MEKEKAEVESQLLQQASGQLRAYRDIAAATRMLRDQMKHREAGSDAAEASALPTTTRDRRVASDGASSYDADTPGMRSRPGSEGAPGSPPLHSTSGTMSEGSGPSAGVDSSAAHLRSLSLAMVQANEVMGALEAAAFAPSTRLEVVMEALGSLQLAAVSVAQAQWAARALRGVGALGGAPVGTSGLDRSRDSDVTGDSAGSDGSIDARDSPSCGEADEADAWAHGAWRRLEHHRNAMRAIAAGGMADSLKRLGWPPPPDAKPGAWTLSSDGDAADGAAGGDGGEARLAQSAMALTLLQRWSVAWAAALAPATGGPSTPVTRPAGAPSTMQHQSAPPSGGALPVLWSVQIVAKPLVTRLRSYATSLAERAGGGGGKAPKDPSAPLPPSLWARGLDPSLLFAFVFDAFAVLPGGLLAGLGEGAPLTEGVRQGVAAGLMLWAELLATHGDGRADGADAAGTASHGATALPPFADSALGLLAATSSGARDGDTPGDVDDVDGALYLDLRGAVLEQLLAETVRMCAGAASEAAAGAALSARPLALDSTSKSESLRPTTTLRRRGSSGVSDTKKDGDSFASEDEQPSEGEHQGGSADDEVHGDTAHWAAPTPHRSQALLNRGIVASFDALLIDQASAGAGGYTTPQRLALNPLSLLPSRLLDDAIAMDTELTAAAAYGSVSDGPYAGVSNVHAFMPRYVSRPPFALSHLLFVAPTAASSGPHATQLSQLLSSPDTSESARLRCLLRSEAALLASAYISHWRPLVRAFVSGRGEHAASPAVLLGLLGPSTRQHFSALYARYSRLLYPHATALTTSLASLLCQWVVRDALALLRPQVTRERGGWFGAALQGIRQATAAASGPTSAPDRAASRMRPRPVQGATMVTKDVATSDNAAALGPSPASADGESHLDPAYATSGDGVASAIGVGALMRHLVRSITPLQRRVAAAVAPQRQDAASSHQPDSRAQAVLGAEGSADVDTGLHEAPAVDVTDEQGAGRPHSGFSASAIDTSSELLPLDLSIVRSLAILSARPLPPRRFLHRAAAAGHRSDAHDEIGGGELSSEPGHTWDAAVGCAGRLLTLIDAVLLPLAEESAVAFVPRHRADLGGDSAPGDHASESEAASVTAGVSPTALLARARGELVRALATTIAGSFAESARPWLQLVNVWHFRLYSDPARPPDAAAVARAALLTASVDLRHAIEACKRTASIGCSVHPGGCPASPASTGTATPTATADCTCAWWAGDVAALTTRGLDSLLFRAVVSRSDVDGFRAGVTHGAPTGEDGLPRVPGGAVLLLQSLPGDAAQVCWALGGCAAEPIEGQADVASLLPAVNGLVALCRLPTPKAASLRTMLTSLLVFQEGGGGEGEEDADDDDADEEEDWNLGRGGSRGGQDGSAPRSSSSSVIPAATKTAIDALIAGAGVMPDAPLVRFRGRYVAGAARVLAGPACVTGAGAGMQR